jgi:DNA mismatch endonuclease (patch repair protein)
MDVLTRRQRSYCMSQVRGRNTAPELALRKALWARGLRYRLKNSLTGRPDIVFHSARVAVFVDGCFWHGCPVHAVMPKTRVIFWMTKIGRTRFRDREVGNALKQRGWQVIRVWEHQVNKELRQVVARIVSAVKRRREL